MADVKNSQEKAASYFMIKPANFPVGRPLNCCESVLLTLAEHLGIESDLIPKIATGIGAGVSLNGLLCGSISGATLAIGIKYGRSSIDEDPTPVWALVDEFLTAFRSRFRYVTCRQLTRLDLKTSEGLKEYFASVHDYACTDRVRFAVEKAEEILSR